MANKRLLSVDRKIHFFKITADEGDGGLLGEKIFEIDEQIDPSQRETIYKGDHANFSLDLRSSKEGLIFGTFFQSREEAPSKRKDGEITRTPVELEEDENINESTHFVYSPKSSYIAVEWNFHGPKIGLMVWVINHLYQTIDKKEKRNGWMYIRSGKAYGEVMKHQNIRSVTAALKDPSETSGLDINAQAPEVTGQMLDISEAKLELSLRARKPGGIVMALQELKQKFIPTQEAVELYDKLTVEVEDQTGKAVEFDLVKDKLVRKVAVSKDAETGEVDSEGMFNCLEEELLFVIENYIT